MNGAEQFKTASNAGEQVNEKAADAGRTVSNAVNEQRRNAAQGLDTASDAVNRNAQQLPKPFDQYANDVKDGLSGAASYVRQHDAGDMAEDALDTVRDHPFPSLLVLGAVIVGGGILIASLVSEGAGETDNAHGAKSLLTAAANGLGPKATATIIRMRDAAFNMALTKAVDAVEEMFPGFREHFEQVQA